MPSAKVGLLCATVLVVMAVMPALGQSATNLLTNPGFETGYVGQRMMDAISGWTPESYPVWDWGRLCSSATTAAHAGTNAFQLDAFADYNKLMSSPWRCTSGVVYEVETWMKSPAGANYFRPTNGFCYVKVQYFNSAGTLIGIAAESESIVKFRANGPTNWARFTTGPVLAPVGAVTGRAIVGYCPGGNDWQPESDKTTAGFVYIDDVRVFTNVDHTAGALGNYSFEVRNGDYLPLTNMPFWSGFGLEGGVVTNKHHSGEFSLQVWGVNSLSGQRWPATRSNKYATSAWIYSTNFTTTSAWAQVILQYLDSTNGVLLEYASPRFNSQSASNTWIQYEAMGVAPSGTVYGRTMLGIVGTNVGFGASTAWFDDATQRLVSAGGTTAGLIGNGGFDDGPSGNAAVLETSKDLPCWDWMGGTNAGFVNQAYRTNGEQSLSITYPANSIGQDFVATSGVGYFVEGYIYNPASEKLTGSAYGVLSLEFYKGSNLVSTYDGGRFTSASPSNTWVKFSVTNRAPWSGVVSGRVVCAINGSATGFGGALYFDALYAAETNLPMITNTQAGVLWNPGFDFTAPGTIIGQLDDWAGFGNAGFVLDTYKRSGRNALKLAGPDNFIQQDWSVTQGWRYASSAYAFTPSADRFSGDTNLHAVVQLQFLDSDSNALVAYESSWFMTNATPDTWTNLEVLGTAPTGAKYGRTLLGLFGDSTGYSGSVWFDDVTQRVAFTSGVAGILINPDFEDGFGYWTNIPGWTVLSGVSNGASVTDPVYDGGRARCVWDGGGSDQFLSQEFGLTSAQYRVDGYIYSKCTERFDSSNGVGYGVIILQWLDAMGTVVEQTESGHFTNDSPCDTWVYYCFTSVPPDDAVSGRVLLGIVTRNEDAGGSLYFDSIGLSSIDDVTPPSIPENLAATARSPLRVDFSWEASTDSGVGVRGYKVFCNSNLVDATMETTFTCSVTPGTNYFTVASMDELRNTSLESTGVVVITAADVEVPAQPSNVVAEALGPDQVQVTWDIPSDDWGVARYQVLKDGIRIGTTATNRYVAGGLSPDTEFVFRIGAFDDSDNSSALSTNATARTPAGSIAEQGSFADPIPDGFVRPPTSVYATANAQLPIPTADWWTSIARVRCSGLVAARPLLYYAKGWALEVGYPYCSSPVTTSVIRGSFIRDMSIMATGGTFSVKPNGESRVDGWGDFSVRTRIGDPDSYIMATLVHGSPYTYLTFSNCSPRIDFPVSGYAPRYTNSAFSCLVLHVQRNNLLTNGALSGTGTAPNGWQNWFDTSHDPDSSVYRSAGNSWVFWNDGGIYQGVASGFGGGGPLVFGGYLRHPSSDPMRGGTKYGIIQLEFYNGGTLISTYSASPTVSSNSPKDTWIFSQGTAVVPSNATQARLVIRCNDFTSGDGRFQADDVFMARSVEPVYDNDYALFGPAGTAWNTANPTSILITLPAGQNYMSVAALSSRGASFSTNELEVLKAHAFAFVTNTVVSLEYARTSGLVKATFTSQVQSMQYGQTGTLMGLLPHHWKYSSADLVPGMIYDSILGDLRISDANSFQTATPFYGIVPQLPQPDDVGWNVGAFESLARQVPGPDPTKTDTYYQFKDLYRIARMVPPLDSARLPALRDQYLDWMRISVTNLLTYTEGEPNNFFAYDTNWCSLVGYDEAFSTVQYLNDHHFQYGMLAYCAGVLGLYDRSFVMAYSNMVEMVIRDYNNPSRGAGGAHPLPWLRHFDPWEGHSWASGVGGELSSGAPDELMYPGETNMANYYGPDEESSSEAMNSWAGMFPWGLAANNDEFIDMGAVGYSLEALALREYWYDVDGSNHDTNFDRTMACRLFGGKLDPDTWFGTNMDLAWGIHYILTGPHMTYQGYFEDYRITDYTFFKNSWGVTNIHRYWKYIHGMYRGFFEPETVLAEYDPLDNASDAEDNSRANYYNWMHTMNSLGRVCTILYSDLPALVVFGEGTSFTYAAYNYFDHSITVAVRRVDDSTLHGWFTIPNRGLQSFRSSDDSDQDGLNTSQEFLSGTDPFNPDTDDDGMPDGWEWGWFGCMTNTGDGDFNQDGVVNVDHYVGGTDPTDPDSDHDGMSNVDEMRAGTSATNANSFLGFSAAVWPSNSAGPIVQWYSVTGKSYRVDRSSNLMGGSWSLLLGGITGMPPMNVYTDQAAPETGMWLYRIGLE
ncbi:MAG TPA: glycosyl hydrolase [Kiritimatiellia bacterium]|nr:glycosyl hydrolase [Kiritimatiellia bacterium]